MAGELLDAAEAEFSTHGFEGASTRRIAERAGAHQPQINYHFSSKERLWRSVVDRLFAELDEAFGGWLAQDGAPVATMSATIDAFIDFSARRPELNRIINLEATAASDRLSWLVSEHLSPRREAVGAYWDEARAAGLQTDLDADDVWDLVTSYGALHFANAPMVALVSARGIDPPADHARKIKGLLGLGEPR